MITNNCSGWLRSSRNVKSIPLSAAILDAVQSLTLFLSWLPKDAAILPIHRVSVAVKEGSHMIKYALYALVLFLTIGITIARETLGQLGLDSSYLLMTVLALALNYRLLPVYER